VHTVLSIEIGNLENFLTGDNSAGEMKSEQFHRFSCQPKLWLDRNRRYRVLRQYVPQNHRSMIIIRNGGLRGALVLLAFNQCVGTSGESRPVRGSASKSNRR